MKIVNNTVDRKQKVALVTGGSRGIGRAIVELLLENNIFVIINYAFNEENAVQLHNELSTKYGNSFALIKADLSLMSDAEILIDFIRKSVKEIDYLIFCAGATLKKDFGDIEYTEWIKVFDLNLNIPFMILQKLDKDLARNGRIIFISSIMSKYPHSTSIAYGVSKAAVNTLTRYIVKVYANRRITVNSILVGFANTTMISRSSAHEERIKAKIALGRFVDPKEVAEFVWSIIKNEYVNGANLEISGGYDFF